MLASTSHAGLQQHQSLHRTACQKASKSQLTIGVACGAMAAARPISVAARTTEHSCEAAAARAASCSVATTSHQPSLRAGAGRGAASSQGRTPMLQHGVPIRSGRLAGMRPSAGAMDVMPTWTLDQIAGLVFGAVMLAAVLGAQTVDQWVARAQRRQLGICETCGGVNDPASCSQQGCPMRK